MFGSSFDEPLSRLEVVIDGIQKTGLKLKPEKCHLFQQEVTFLGHAISPQGVLPNPDNVVKLVNWPAPTSVTVGYFT